MVGKSREQQIRSQIDTKKLFYLFGILTTLIGALFSVTVYIFQRHQNLVLQNVQGIKYTMLNLLVFLLLLLIIIWSVVLVILFMSIFGEKKSWWYKRSIEYLKLQVPKKTPKGSISLLLISIGILSIYVFNNIFVAFFTFVIYFAYGLKCLVIDFFEVKILKIDLKRYNLVFIPIMLVLGSFVCVNTLFYLGNGVNVEFDKGFYTMNDTVRFKVEPQGFSPPRIINITYSNENILLVDRSNSSFPALPAYVTINSSVLKGEPYTSFITVTYTYTPQYLLPGVGYPLRGTETEVYLVPVFRE